MGCEVEYGAEADHRRRAETASRDRRRHERDQRHGADARAVALFADGPTPIHNVAHIRHKETDRIGALATELRKLGAEVDERPDGLRIRPGPLRGARRSTPTTTTAWR